MEFRYCLLDTLVGDTHRYGIAAIEDAAILSPFVDLSLDCEPVRRLVELCNELTLDILHLPDVIEDFLVSA